MGDIFICHSRHDHNLVIFMNEICTNAGVRGREFEFNFAAMGRTANEEIASIMRGCSVLFVLLGNNVSFSIHTSNWVSAEVGLARGLNIPIWVVEDVFVPVNFPVPFVNHYVRVNVRDPAHRDPQNHHYMQELVKAYGNHPSRSGDITIPSTTNLQCSKGGCQAVFAVHQPIVDIKKCPVCGVEQTWGNHPLEQINLHDITQETINDVKNSLD